MANSELKGEFVLMMDGLVQTVYRGGCRKASGLDFSDLAGKWVPHDAFNAYITRLREYTGEFGPSIVGTKIITTLNTIAPLKEQFPTLGTYLANSGGVYLASNRGPDVGEYKVAEYEEEKGLAVVVTTSPLDEVFHMAVLEGIIRFYIHRKPRSEIVERMADTGRSVFRYTWRV